MPTDKDGVVFDLGPGWKVSVSEGFAQAQDYRESVRAVVIPTGGTLVYITVGSGLRKNFDGVSPSLEKMTELRRQDVGKRYPNAVLTEFSRAYGNRKVFVVRHLEYPDRSGKACLVDWIGFYVDQVPVQLVVMRWSDDPNPMKYESSISAWIASASLVRLKD